MTWQLEEGREGSNGERDKKQVKHIPPLPTVGAGHLARAARKSLQICM